MGTVEMNVFQIDEAYEFSAPHFFDFINEETEEDVKKAEHWFVTALTYPQSPFMPKIKGSRSVQVESVMCDFEDVAETQVQVVETISTSNGERPVEHDESMNAETSSFEIDEVGNEIAQGAISALPSSSEMEKPRKDMAPAEIVTIPSSNTGAIQGMTVIYVTIEALIYSVGQVITHSLKTKNLITGKGPAVAAQSILKNLTAKNTVKLSSKQSALKPNNLMSMVRGKREIEPISQIGNAAENALYNRAHKRQKLEDGKTHAQVAPYVSMAEIVNKFQSNTRELFQNKSHSQDERSSIVRRSKLTLTRPKEPKLVTADRGRSVKLKSSAEIEDEMLAKIPKFKARPMNKKILEAPSLPAPPRSIPRPPEFQEFHLKTLERANQHEASSVCSTSLDVPSKKQGQRCNKFVQPKLPRLETMLRARPPTVKSSAEIELEELEKMPKFKARPLNKKILERKGDPSLFCNKKRQVTTPKEFHFATNERLPSSNIVVEHFDKFPPKPTPKECTKMEAFQLESLVRHEDEMQRIQEEREEMERKERQKRNFIARPVLIEDPIPLPKKVRKPLTEVQEFALHVDHRAVDRVKFDKKACPLMKEKEMVYKRQREDQENAKMMEEESEVKQMRMTMVPHARPLPKFDNPFLPQKRYSYLSETFTKNNRLENSSQALPHQFIFNTIES
ncbi:Protein TPX2 [Acorus calamus]|uniref:Protein TPX2 n=1 Tax=Acorus calamus TaxID=4465 RepID=A0AAV9DLS3_ACOCL|nr:Protein TPX2 [Acorus calamus]